MSKGRVAVIASFAGIAVGVGVLVPRLPSLSYGVLAILAASAVALSVTLARMGRTLDPAFVVVAATLLTVPWGVLGLFTIIPIPFAILGLTPFVVAAWWVRPQARHQTVLLVPLLLLAMLAAISLAWSFDPVYGREKLSIWLFTGLMPAAFVLVLAASSTRISWTLVLAVSVLTSVYFLLTAAPDPEYGLQPTIFGWNPIWSARVASVGALVALFGPFPMWVRVLALPVLLMHGWTTGSLGPLLGLALGVGAGVVETLRLRESGGRRVSIGLLGIWLVIGCVLVVFLTGLIDPVLTPVTDDTNVTGRANFLAATPSLFIASPVVGTGLGGFTVAGFQAQYPHNLPVEIGVELGMLGLLALLAWWLLALRGAVGSPLLVALLVATSVFSLFSGSLASNEAFWLFSGLAVAMVPRGRPQQVQRERNHRAVSAKLTQIAP
jgi:O-antigen ligase